MTDSFNNCNIIKCIQAEFLKSALNKPRMNELQNKNNGF